MSSQLDILALEPFYGGIRRSMLECVMRCSRHRWTLLKLPPRRMERRLTAAAHWFAEQLSRHWVGRIDLVFASEALNLADLIRLMPPLAKKPLVVYFHSNQLPVPGREENTPLEVVNLSTATAATEIWFNSVHHLKTFLHRASALVERHPEISGRSPMSDIIGKAHLMAPPMDLQMAGHVLKGGAPGRSSRTLFVETRDANVKLLNFAMGTLRRRGEQFDLVTVGPVEELSADLPRTTVPESDDYGQVAGMLKSSVFVSGQNDAMIDHHAIRAISADCWPVVPRAGFYGELIPESLHPNCVYDGTPDGLASKIQDAWHQGRPDGHREKFHEVLRRFDAIAACKAIDERVEELAVRHSVRR